MIYGEEKFYVEYAGDLACTSFPGIKPGQYDITGKNFRDFTLGLVNATNTDTSITNCK
jgi:hypothetical protein